MFLTFTEVYEDVTHYNNAVGKKYWLTREVAVNPEHINMLRPDEQISHFLLSNREQTHNMFKEGQQFTRLTVNKGMTGSDIIVLGSLEYITEFINREGNEKKRTLKG